MVKMAITIATLALLWTTSGYADIYRYTVYYSDQAIAEQQIASHQQTLDEGLMASIKADITRQCHLGITQVAQELGLRG